MAAKMLSGLSEDKNANILTINLFYNSVIG